MNNKSATIVGVMIGIGFAIPSLFGVIAPVASASHWQLELVEKAAIDQYRTLSLLVLVVGALISFGATRAAYVHASLFSCIVLLSALLLGRFLSIATGEVTPLLLIETIVETIAIIIVFWAFRSISYNKSAHPSADASGD